MVSNLICERHPSSLAVLLDFQLGGNFKILICSCVGKSTLAIEGNVIAILAGPFTTFSCWVRWKTTTRNYSHYDSHTPSVTYESWTRPQSAAREVAHARLLWIILGYAAVSCTCCSSLPVDVSDLLSWLEWRQFFFYLVFSLVLMYLKQQNGSKP